MGDAPSEDATHSLGGTAPAVFEPIERVRIAILVRYRPDWLGLEPLYRELTQYPQFDVTVVAVEELWAYREFTTDYLQEIGIPHVPEEFYDVSVHQPAIVVCTNAHTADSRTWLLEGDFRIVYIPYASSISDEASIHEYQYDQPLHRVAWRIYCQGDFHKEQYKLYCSSGSQTVRALGLPKLEGIYSNYMDTTNDRFQFLWNIHFDPDGLYSTWNEYADTIFSIPQNQDGVELIMRPHPGFRDIAGPEHYERITRQTGPYSLDEDPSTKSSFEKSNAMISDGSSLILDYAFTFKPIIFLIKEPPVPLNKLAFDFLEAGHYIARSSQDIQNLSKLLASGQDPKRQSREDFLTKNHQSFMEPEGTSARIVDDLSQGLADEVVKGAVV